MQPISPISTFLLIRVSFSFIFVCVCVCVMLVFVLNFLTTYYSSPKGSKAHHDRIGLFWQLLCTRERGRDICWCCMLNYLMLEWHVYLSTDCNCIYLWSSDSVESKLKELGYSKWNVNGRKSETKLMICSIVIFTYWVQECRTEQGSDFEFWTALMGLIQFNGCLLLPQTVLSC